MPSVLDASSACFLQAIETDACVGQLTFRPTFDEEFGNRILCFKVWQIITFPMIGSSQSFNEDPKYNNMTNDSNESCSLPALLLDKHLAMWHCKIS